jgi:hypothetical protein
MERTKGDSDVSIKSRKSSRIKSRFFSRNPSTCRDNVALLVAFWSRSGLALLPD